MALKLSKQQRLSSKKEIDQVFKSGRSSTFSPIRFVYSQKSGQNTRTQVLFSVPSRTFKKAVDRNLLKRRMREAFRVNQKQLQIPVKLNLAYIYIGKQVMAYPDIEKKIILSFQKLKNEFEA